MLEAIGDGDASLQWLGDASRTAALPAMTSDTKPPPPILVALAFASIYLTWGTTYKAMSIGVRDEGLPPLLFGGSRILMGGMLLWIIQAFRGESLRLTLREAGLLGLVGTILFLGGNGLITIGLRSVPSGMTAVVAATTPLFMSCFALLLPHGDRLTYRGWAGLLLGVLGVLVLMQGRQSSSVPIQWYDVAFCFGSACAWAIGSLLVRHLHLGLPRMSSASYQMIFGGFAQIALGCMLGEGNRLPAQITPTALGAFLYLLFVGSLWGFIAFSWLLAHVSAAKVGTYAYVNPVIALLIASFFGEHLDRCIIGGAVVVLLAVFLVRGGERVPSPAPTLVPDEEVA